MDGSGGVEPNVRWTRELYGAMQPFSAEAVDLNYLDTDGTERIPAVYDPPTHARLWLLKERYDPSNFFRVNQNTVPAME